MDWIEPAGQEAPHSGQQAGGWLRSVPTFLDPLECRWLMVVANVDFLYLFVVNPFGLN